MNIRQNHKRKIMETEAVRYVKSWLSYAEPYSITGTPMPFSPPVWIAKKWQEDNSVTRLFSPEEEKAINKLKAKGDWLMTEFLRLAAEELPDNKGGIVAMHKDAVEALKSYYQSEVSKEQKTKDILSLKANLNGRRTLMLLFVAMRHDYSPTGWAAASK